MAVSDGALFILIAQVLTYHFLYCHKVKIWRIIGGFAVILIGLSAIAVEDTIPVMVFTGISIIVGFIGIATETVTMVK